MISLLNNYSDTKEPEKNYSFSGLLGGSPEGNSFDPEFTSVENRNIFIKIIYRLY
jgi:hypothetical protein